MAGDGKNGGQRTAVADRGGAPRGLCRWVRCRDASHPRTGIASGARCCNCCTSPAPHSTKGTRNDTDSRARIPFERPCRKTPQIDWWSAAAGRECTKGRGDTEGVGAAGPASGGNSHGVAGQGHRDVIHLDRPRAFSIEDAQRGRAGRRQQDLAAPRWRILTRWAIWLGAPRSYRGITGDTPDRACERVAHSASLSI